MSEGRDDGFMREPVTGVVTGLVIILMGVCTYLRQASILSSDVWWAYALTGAGALWTLGVIVRLFVPRWRHRLIMLMFIPGVLAAGIGVLYILNSPKYWPAIILVVGLARVLMVLAKIDIEPNAKQRVLKNRRRRSE